MKFTQQKEYIRNVLAKTVHNTAEREGYINVSKLSPKSDFVVYQNKFIKNVEKMPSHIVIKDHISRFGEDYRVQDKEHPIKGLRDRKMDNTSCGREVNE